MINPVILICRLNGVIRFTKLTNKKKRKINQLIGKYERKHCDSFSVPRNESERYSRLVITDYIDDLLRQKNMRNIVINRKSAEHTFAVWELK